MKDKEKPVGRAAVLDDGTRILSERAITKAFGGKRGGSHWKRLKDNPDGAYLPVFLSAANIKPFINKDLEDGLGRRRYYRQKKGGTPAYGIEAVLLPKICNVYLKMRDDGTVLNNGGKMSNEQNDAWITVQEGRVREASLEDRRRQELSFLRKQIEVLEYAIKSANLQGRLEAFAMAMHKGYEPEGISRKAEEIEIRIWNEAVEACSQRVFLALGADDSLKFIEGMLR